MIAHTAAAPPPTGGNDAIQASDTPATRRQRASHGAKPPSQPPEVRRIAYKTWHSTGWREKTRPTPPLQQHFRERIHPARHKTPNLGHFERAGRTLSRSRPPSDQAGTTFSRTRRDNAEALKPTTPLLTPNKEALKPASPLLSPNNGPLKPTSPLHPKTAPKTPISHPQRR